MQESSTPLMDANTMDVGVMDSKSKAMLLSLVVGASITLLRRRKIMAGPKTHKVRFVDGTEGRAVRLSPRNHLTVLNWIPGAEFRESVAKGGQTSNHRLMLPILGTKKIRAAYYDDWVVKTEAGFQVVKFDKVQETLFFPDAWDENVLERRFKAWVKEVG